MRFLNPGVRGRSETNSYKGNCGSPLVKGLLYLRDFLSVVNRGGDTPDIYYY